MLGEERTRHSKDDPLTCNKINPKGLYTEPRKENDKKS